MGIFRIPDCPPIAAPLAGPDLFEVWDSSAQISSRITADQMAAFFGGGGGSQDLDNVLANGNTSDLTIQLEDTVAGTSTTYKSGGMESVGYIIDMIDGPFLIQGPQGLFNFDNSGNIVEIVDFDEFRYSYASNVLMSVNGAGQSVIFNTDSFSVGSPVFPNIFVINGLSNTVSFDTSAFDIESDVFRVGSVASPDIMMIDSTSNIVSFNTGFDTGGMTFTTDSIGLYTISGVTGGGNIFSYNTGGVIFEMNATESFFQLGGISKHSIRGGSPVQDLFVVEASNITFGTKATFLDSTATTELFQIDTGNNRLQAFAPIIATDSIGDYIKCETPSGPRAIRLDTII